MTEIKLRDQKIFFFIFFIFFLTKDKQKVEHKTISKTQEPTRTCKTSHGRENRTPKHKWQSLTPHRWATRKCEIKRY